MRKESRRKERDTKSDQISEEENSPVDGRFTILPLLFFLLSFDQCSSFECNRYFYTSCFLFLIREGQSSTVIYS